MPSARRGRVTRCGHYEQLKFGARWKCAACGRLLTISESVQNSLETADVLKDAIDGRRSLGESLDELLSRREWDEMQSKISPARKLVTRIQTSRR